MLTVYNLTKRYGDVLANSKVTFTAEDGQITLMVGPNGAGKTTLLKLANGLLQPTEGRIRIAGMAPGPDTKAIVSYLPDAAWLPDWMRVEQLVEMFRDFYGTPSQAKAYIGFDADKANEMLAMRLAVMHNLYFYNQLMQRIRDALDTGTFAQFRAEFSARLDQRI